MAAIVFFVFRFEYSVARQRLCFWVFSVVFDNDSRLSMTTVLSVVNDNDFWVFLGAAGGEFGCGRGQRLLRLIQDGRGHKDGHGRRNKS